MLEIADLHVRRGATDVLRGVSLAVGEREIVTLIGPNGAGKTTLLMTISGLLPVRSGAVSCRINGEMRPLAGLGAERIVAAGIVQCPEGRQVFASLTVRENLLIGAYRRRDQADMRADLERCFERFPILAERQALSAGSLSGGEQMMLSIGRALMARPRLLLLDEPSLGLAPQVVETILDIILEINRAGTTVLLVEQNAELALEIADRGYVLETGRIVHAGTGAALLDDPAVKQAYLGIAP
ncbi:MAG: ABC transporter ATP-binding protein [Geminicoccaceae bacterium]